MQSLIRLQRQLSQTLSCLGQFHLIQDQPAFTFLACASCSTEAMNVNFRARWNADLNDMRDVGEIHTSCCNVR
jgi:hypothetical protein